jgi:homocysteine S-methyltransferase
VWVLVRETSSFALVRMGVGSAASMSENPILGILRHQPVLILDGGLATAMEARGCDLNDPLWSAKVLMEDPELIRQVHLDYLLAGADCIATTSYQATVQGFQGKGLKRDQGLELLVLSSRLALESRDSFWADPENRKGRQKPLVAASIGPYGAFLADGSEYTGDYGISRKALREFHEERWKLLAESGVDLMACETIPSLEETHVLLELLGETQGLWAWVSFSCRDGMHLADGSRLRDAVAHCHPEEGLAAVAINCTAPEFVPMLIREAREATDKPILVYPNSGEVYDAERKVWTRDPSSVSWAEAPKDWVAEGCLGVGGCCRVGPDTIRSLRTLLIDEGVVGTGP